MNTWPAVSPIQISSALKLLVKKFVISGSSRRATAGTCDCGGVTPVSIARPVLPSMPKKLWMWLICTVLVPGSACGVGDDLRRRQAVVPERREVLPVGRAAAVVDGAAVHQRGVHRHRPGVEVAVVEGRDLAVGDGAEEARGARNGGDVRGVVGADVVVGGREEVQPLVEQRDDAVVAGDRRVGAVDRVDVEVAADEAAACR